ncbi:Tight junction-associated protein 1 [Lucilia cuprina]|nr:Tight junction-associated protein 1 [Lucilia cuprina]
MYNYYGLIYFGSIILILFFYNSLRNICETLAPVAVTIAAVAAKEIETLKQTLQEKDTLLMAMEATCITDSERQAELEDSVIAWQDKYDRLYESHKRVQKVNQSLEDKLLKLVDRNTGERAQLTSDVATLSVRLAQANFNISKLQRDIERYKTDINLAIQLLQCKPDGFVPQKISSLPIDIQSKVSSYMRLDTNSHSDSEGSVTGIGISTTAAYKVLPATDSPPPAPCPFPPTAMVYSMRGLDAKQNSESTLNLSNNNNNSTSDTLNNNHSNNNNSGNNTIRNSTTSLNTTTVNTTTNCALNGNDMISPVVMAKFLEDELKASEIKHCDTCQCSKDLTVLADVSRSYSVATQTPFVSNGNLNDSMAQLCLRCYSNLNSPSRTNSPFTKNLLKSSDSVISETKSSVSDLNEMDKLFTPAKKDDLMVNPILGHHRLCERTSLLKGVQGQAGQTAKTSYNTILDNMRTLNGYQRRFIDGGGTALELLEERSKLLNNKKHSLKMITHEDINGNEDLEDEEKPLLGSNMMQSNLMDAELEERESLKIKSKLRTESSCELGVSSRDPIKSPTASTKSALDPKVTNGLLKTQISGSVNSVWSKSSSCEGAKMFENFNRNLIKTIKAENPKYRGPRLCAMRIQQNGQSNILLDNIESIEAITPVIYRRRERLLDEELDDNKDIITSKTTRESQQPAIETAKEATETETAGMEELKATDAPEAIKEEPQTECLNVLATVNPNEETILVCGDEKTDNLLEIKMEAVKPSIQTTTTTNYDNTSKMSGTQSSSISENIDFQETVILRRQQLSRVAEWVQNNTQQMEMEQQQQEQQQQHLNSLNHCDSSVTDHQSSFSTLDQLDSVSVEKLSMDSGYKTTPQLQPITNSSQDETIKTSDDSLSPKSDLNNQSPLNFPPNSNSNINSPKQEQTDNTQIFSTAQTYYRRTSRSGLPVAYTATAAAAAASQDAQDSSSQCSQIIPEQPTCDILNYKYYPNDSDKTRAIKAELHTTTQSVDIAQMEYNVKQFLLKQNEWSMRSTTRTQPITNNQQTGASNSRHSSIRHIKLFTSSSTAGLGPGKGERVRTTISQHNNTTVPSNITNTTAAASSVSTTALGICTKFNDLKVSSTTSSNNSCLNNNHTITTTTTNANGSMPQRTETNL